VTPLTPLKTIGTLLVAVLFPHCCLFCEWPGTVLCTRCSHKLDFCTQIEAPVYYPDLSLVAVCRFNQDSRRIIHTFKYRGIPAFGKRIAELLFHHASLPSIDFITSVPPDPVRKKRRGFDHTQLIAQNLATLLNKPYITTLKKNTQSGAQAKTNSRKERLKNAEHRFSLLPQLTVQQTLAHKKVLLVDDVCTTGSTLRECVYELQKLSLGCHCAVFCIRV